MEKSFIDWSLVVEVVMLHRGLLLNLVGAEPEQEFDGVVVFAAFKNVEDVRNIRLLHAAWLTGVVEKLCCHHHFTD